MPTALIYNPIAGGLKGSGKQDRLIEAARILGADLIATTGPGSGGEIARHAIAAGAQTIVVAGGDGTVNEAAQALIGSTATLGILPAGTANVLANETGMLRGIVEAARALSTFVPRRVAAARLISGRYFLLMAGIGLDAHVVYHLSTPLKKRFGKVAYWVSAFGLLGRDLEEFEIEIDGGKHVCSFALLSKVRNYGGDLNIARNTSLLDDHFEAVLFEGRRTSRYLRYLSGVAFNRLAGIPGVKILRARSAHACCAAGSRVYVQVDGEYAGLLPTGVEMVPDALTLLLPPNYI